MNISTVAAQNNVSCSVLCLVLTREWLGRGGPRGADPGGFNQRQGNLSTDSSGCVCPGRGDGSNADAKGNGRKRERNMDAHAHADHGCAPCPLSACRPISCPQGDVSSHFGSGAQSRSDVAGDLSPMAPSASANTKHLRAAPKPCVPALSYVSPACAGSVSVSGASHNVASVVVAVGAPVAKDRIACIAHHFIVYRIHPTHTSSQATERRLALSSLWTMNTNTNKILSNQTSPLLASVESTVRRPWCAQAPEGAQRKHLACSRLAQPLQPLQLAALLDQ